MLHLKIQNITMKKSLAAYFILIAFLVSSCSSSQKATTSSSSIYPTTETKSGQKKFVAGQTAVEESSPTMRLDSLKRRMAMLEAQLEAIKEGRSSKSKKATAKEVAEINKEIEKVEKEEVASTTQPEKKGQRKFVATPKTKEEIAAEKKKAEALARVKAAEEKRIAAEKEKAVTAKANKPKDTKPVETPKKTTTTPKKETSTANNTTTTKPESSKPAPPPKPKVIYKTITEKVLGNYFMDGSTSSQNMFCLHKTAPVGTQVTVINPMNGRRLTLKVLGKIPNLAEDMGVAIKITYSAARQLNLRDERFELKCTYKMPFVVDPITGTSASVD